ncbi:hypothetical protein ACI2K4_28430 [Micromonospora sp. NPDC050397]|uniref:hypothetical protein n=1 Tax=Micromonospora sp. NPDC050397 TaxID=3364279 RepID=UPI00384DA8F3
MTGRNPRPTTAVVWMQRLVAVVALAAVALLHGTECTSGAVTAALAPAGFAQSHACASEQNATTMVAAADPSMSVRPAVEMLALTDVALHAGHHDRHSTAGSASLCLALLAAAAAVLLSRPVLGWREGVLTAGRAAATAAQRSLRPHLACLCVSRT